MKILGAKKIESKIWNIHFSNEQNDFIHRVLTQKESFITVFGLPLIPRKLIYIYPK